MSNIVVDLFAEDRAHEDFIKSMLSRLAVGLQVSVVINVRTARGGHGRAIDELSRYQTDMRRGILDSEIPDLLVVAIDANSRAFTDARNDIKGKLKPPFEDRTVFACPDPHIEKWYMADLDSFFEVVGTRPTLGGKKCKRDWYKDVLAKAVVDAGHPATLGGIEFARDIVSAMDLYRAGKADNSLKHFLDDTEAALKRLGSTVAVQGSSD